MGTTNYLIKRNDVYYFRQAVPKALKHYIAKREIVVSLSVTERGRAIRAAREIKSFIDNYIYFNTEKFSTPQDHNKIISQGIHEIKLWNSSYEY